MQYPSREADILRLANDIVAGLAAHTDVFPAAPFSPEELQQALAEHDGNREAAIQARAAAAQSTADKDGSLAKIQDMSKAVFRCLVFAGDGAPGLASPLSRYLRPSFIRSSSNPGLSRLCFARNRAVIPLH